MYTQETPQAILKKQVKSTGYPHFWHLALLFFLNIYSKSKADKKTCVIKWPHLPASQIGWLMRKAGERENWNVLQLEISF